MTVTCEGDAKDYCFPHSWDADWRLFFLGKRNGILTLGR